MTSSGRKTFTFAMGMVLLASAVGAAFLGRLRAEASVTGDAQRNGLAVHAVARSVHMLLTDAQSTVQTLAGEVAASPSLSAANLQPLVRRFAEHNTDTFVSMYVIGLDGKEIADYQPGAPDEARRLAGVGVDLGDRSYFQAMLRERRPLVSQAVIGRSTKRPVIVVAAPVLGRDGNLIAVAAGSLDLQALAQLGVLATGTDRVYPVVVDAGGHIVVHRDPLIVAGLLDVGDFEPAAKSLSGLSGTSAPYREQDDVRYVATYAPVPDYGWGVWVAQDERTVGDSPFARAIFLWAIPGVLVLAGTSLLIASRRMQDDRGTPV